LTVSGIEKFSGLKPNEKHTYRCDPSDGVDFAAAVIGVYEREAGPEGKMITHKYKPASLFLKDEHALATEMVG
jgi:hypothetical protein